MTKTEQAEREKLLDEYLAERKAQPNPTREQWAAAVEKWADVVNIESLLRHGSAMGWLGDE